MKLLQYMFIAPPTSNYTLTFFITPTSIKGKVIFINTTIGSSNYRTYGLADFRSRLSDLRSIGPSD